MKNIAIGILSIWLLAACDPVVDNKEMGGIVSESELKLDVHATTDGGNEIIMTNNTPGVGSYWDHITGISTQQTATAALPFLGEQTIKFIGFCDGGQVIATRTVTIKQIDHPVAEEWGLLAGSGTNGKAWVWNLEDYDAVYGTGGWLTELEPSWDVTPVEELEDLDCELIFDLNGGPNLTKIDADGNILEKGRFAFDMSAVKNNPDNGEQWSIGQLKLTGVSVLSGHAFYDDSNIITTFEILELTDDTMVLCWNPSDAEAWTDATFWCLRKKSLMACDDTQGNKIMEVCRVLGIKIPEEIAVLGVDNDEIICSLSDPPLSSVNLNIVKGGYEAAQLIERLMRDKEASCEDVVIHPTTITNRLSTDIYSTGDPYILVALKYIHQNLATKITVEDVVRQVPLSRRLLEIHFKQVTGSSIYQYIFNLRMERFSQLLLESSEPIADIAMSVGLSDYKNLARQFKLWKKYTPAEYRKIHRVK